MKDHTRKDDVVCRYVGEEYMILLSETEMTRCMEISKLARQSVEELTIEIENNMELKVTISIGMTRSDM